MTTRTAKEKTVTICPGCGIKLTLKNQAEIGHRITCLHCGTELQVVGTQPLKLGRSDRG